MMSEKDRMLAGKLYRVDDSLRQEIARAQALTDAFNALPFEAVAEQEKLLRQLFGSVGANPRIMSSFRCDYGSNIHIGDNFYANYDCIIIDVCEVHIGTNVMLGPRTCIYTATHPLDAAKRRQGLEFGKPVRIEDDVWIGGNAVVNPGVAIGNGSVIGSGSIVTHDIPAGSSRQATPAK